MPIDGTYKVEVDWDNNGDYSHAYADITDDVETIRGLEMGKDEDYGEALSALVTIAVKDTNGKYSEFNSSSPLYGNLKPRRRVRISSLTPVAKELFNGYLGDIVPNPHKQEQSADIYCTDALTVLSNVEIMTQLFESKKTGYLIAEILACADWSEGASWILDTSELGIDTVLGFTPTNIDEGQDTVSYAWWHRRKGRVAIREVEASELGFFYQNGEGKAVFEDRHHRLKGDHLVSQATFSDNFVEIRSKTRDKDIKNEVISTFTPRSVAGSLTDLWQLRTIPLIQAGDTYTVEGDFATPAKDVATPVATTDYTANAQEGGGGDDKTGDITISTTVYGQGARFEVTNGASVPVYLTLLKIRGKAINDQEDITRIAFDADSQKAYQKRTHRLDEAKWLPSANAAQDRCDFVLSRFKEPQPTIIVKLHGGSDDDGSILTQMLTREISDRITVVSSRLGLNDDFFINKIEHTIRFKDGHEHTTEWTLVLASDEEYWLLGTSELGTGTRLAY